MSNREWPKHINMHGPDITAREWQYLELVADGFSYLQVGYRLHVTDQTVKRAMDRLKSRWGARSTINLIHLAWKKGYFNHLAALPREDSNLQQTP